MILLEEMPMKDEDGARQNWESHQIVIQVKEKMGEGK